jgi:hypothetical protein
VLFAVGFFYSCPFQLRSPPPIPNIGLGLGGNIIIPQDELKQSFSYVEGRAFEFNHRGQNWTKGGTVATWLSFISTSVINLILGFFGRAPAQNGAAPDTSGLSTNVTRTIGLLAAAAAVLTASGSLIKDQGLAYYAASDKAVALIARSRADIEGAQGESEQRAVLTELKLQVDRL